MLTLIVIMAIGLIALTPLALDGFRGASQYWERLSFIGQTYGAASALLAGLALIGIVATLVVQARETRNARERALRDSNSELLRMAMENPEYRECWGENFPEGDGTAQRQAMYMNMILSQWEMAYDSRAIEDELLRAMARKVFSGEVGWRFWQQARRIRISTAATRRARRFHRILDEEFHRIPEPESRTGREEQTAPKASGNRAWAAGAAVVAAAVACGIVWLRRRAGARTER